MRDERLCRGNGVDSGMGTPTGGGGGAVRAACICRKELRDLKLFMTRAVATVGSTVPSMSLKSER